MPSLSPRSRRQWRLLATVVIAAAVVVAARWPATTAVGFNFHVTVKRLTLLEKAVAFVDRDLEMRRLTREIAGYDGTQEQRLFRMYEWVADNIHPTPPGLPVIDDHVWHIFVRQYGEGDQRAEALAALASYDGMPAATIPLGKDPRKRLVQLTVVTLGDRLVVFDVNNRLVFRKSSGELAALSDLQADPSIIQRISAGVMVDGAPYYEYFARFGEVSPGFVRMEKQRFWSRLKDELIERLGGS